MDLSIRKLTIDENENPDTGNGNPPPKDPPRQGSAGRTVPKDETDETK